MKKDNNTSIVYAFIDSQNLNMGIKSCGWSLDYLEFRNYLRTKYNVKKAYLFIGYISKNATLYQYLQECGFILIFKPVLEIKKGKKITYKGNVDAELVLHAMIHLKTYRQAIIVSGDGDFRCLVEYLADNKKLLKVLVPNQRYSSFLREFAPYIVQLSLLKDKLRSKQVKRSKRKE